MRLFAWFAVVGSISIGVSKPLAYSEQVVRDFMQGCALTSEIEAFCRCTIETLPTIMTEEAYREVVEQAHRKGETKPLEEVSLEAMKQCKALLP